MIISNSINTLESELRNRHPDSNQIVVETIKDFTAAELNKIKAMYETANNEEYQMRVQQLKKLDKKIFGYRATRIYKDFSKPIALIGGDYIELPKNYLDIRLQHSAEKSK